MSYFRKSEDDSLAYMVIISIPNVEDRRKSETYRMIDFTEIMPDFPEEGILVATSHMVEEDGEHVIG